MMGQIFMYHFLREFSRCYTKVTPSPKMPPPISLLYQRKFLKNLSGHPPLDPAHDIRGRNIGRCGDQDMHMIFTHNTPQYLDFKPLTRLPDKLPHSQSYIPLQHMIAVFGDPDKMVFDFEFSMAALSIIHVGNYRPTASKMLPA
jgi:hypothetical protein